MLPQSYFKWIGLLKTVKLRFALCPISHKEDIDEKEIGLALIRAVFAHTSERCYIRSGAAMLIRYKDLAKTI